ILLFVEIGNTAETELFGQLFFYEEDKITLHHNFNIETICRFLDKAFPKEMLKPIFLSPEEQQKRKENIIQRLKCSIRQHQTTIDAEQLR
ncbi:hypothetical protein ABFV54_27295, partial [Pseudomonas syringae]|uniref:hypothetical protein n=1 Tax=Pseudomonas syringae TaxID=317 RepID=UPI0034D550D5